MWKEKIPSILIAWSSIILLPLQLAENARIVFFNYSSFECVFTEEGYDSGVSPEPLANVTAVPLVSEILQVWIPSIDCNALSACPAVNIQYPVLI